MTKRKFTEEQIAFALRQAQTGIRVEEIRRKFGSLGVSELRRLK